MTETYVVEKADEGGRLDVFLTQLSEYTRSRLRTLIIGGNVTVCGVSVTKAGYALRAADIVEVNVPEPVMCNAAPEDLPLDIVFEDSCLAVVNKAQGMVTHPSTTTPNGTLVNALMYRLDSLSTINGVIRPGIVHRLDKDTSGLLVVAKTNEAHLNLQSQIARRTAGRRYLALLDGNLKADSGVVDAPIGRSRANRQKMAICEDGRSAITDYAVLERFGKYTLVEFKLHTGRTHQIRVHASSLGHPVVGDRVYGGSDAFGLKGQLLHAYRLEFDHPKTGEKMTFSAPLPDYFAAVLKKLGSTRLSADGKEIQ